MGLFSLGKTGITPGAQELLIKSLLARHVTGDWGELTEHDKQANDDAVKDGTRIFSAYIVGSEKIWVITEADRSVTTLLLPGEY